MYCWDYKGGKLIDGSSGLFCCPAGHGRTEIAEAVYKQMLEYLIRDEARHVTFGINYLTDFVQTLSEEEQLDRANFALEACIVSRNRLRPYDVWKRYGMSIEETEEYQKKEVFEAQFQNILFSRIMPNLKKIGLLKEELIPAYEKLGLMRYADGDSDY